MTPSGEVHGSVDSWPVTVWLCAFWGLLTSDLQILSTSESCMVVQNVISSDVVQRDFSGWNTNVIISWHVCPKCQHETWHLNHCYWVNLAVHLLTSVWTRLQLLDQQSASPLFVGRYHCWAAHRNFLLPCTVHATRANECLMLKTSISDVYFQLQNIEQSFCGLKLGFQLDYKL